MERYIIITTIIVTVLVFIMLFSRMVTMLLTLMKESQELSNYRNELSFVQTKIRIHKRNMKERQ